jgi:hypothetical protein
MNIPQLRTSIPSFIQIDRYNYETRENVFFSSIGKIQLIVLRFQYFWHITNISPLTTNIPSFIKIELSKYELEQMY